MPSFFALTILFFVVIYLAWVNTTQAKRFSAMEAEWRRIEGEWRERERVLVDRLLRRDGVQPLTVERENILRLPDAETPQETWADVVMREDAILEEIEQLIPGARGMSPSQAREAFPIEWRRISDRYVEERTPLRAG